MADKREPAIIIRGIKKEYRLGSITAGTLQSDLESWWAKKRGKQDPNREIGFDERLVGKRFMALNGIDLTIYKGERIGIIGVNGAGKSTLLKLLSRITAPTEGDIDLYGRVSSMLEVGTGFHAELTGRENIYLNGSILGMTRAEIDERMDDIIEFSEIEEFIDTPAKRYSSGMFVKLAFAVAAHLNSEIMIMDEVLAVGDMGFQRKCLAKMREAADKEGRTVLYVSHNMNTIRELCDRCIVLDQGKIIFDGETERAIAMYMEHSLGEDEVDIDLSTKSRGRQDYNDVAKMTHLEIIDKATPLFAENEDLNLRLTVDSSKELEDVILRVTFRTETDTAIGTAWSTPHHIKEGISEHEYRIPLDTVIKGVFLVSIGLYTNDEIGRFKCYDHITRAFRIEVTGTPNWSTDAYGYTEMEITTL